MKIVLGITGSVAAEIAAKLYVELIAAGHDIAIVATDSGLKLALNRLTFSDSSLQVSHILHTYNSKHGKTLAVGEPTNPFKNIIIDDRAEYKRYQTPEKEILHIELAQWADALLIAPCTANTMAKLVYGLADNALTSTALAFMGYDKPVFIAPAMNTHMWMAPATKRNLTTIISDGVRVIYPTAKLLKCGDIGVGGMADIKAITDIIKGVDWRFPFDFHDHFIPVAPHAGSFGFKRHNFYHTGVDIYCKGCDPVYAVEDGKVVAFGKFTGASIGTSHWEETDYLAVEGNSGTVLYGEIKPDKKQMKIGKKITRGSLIGKVIPVLLEGKVRADIPHHSRHMLHMELYSTWDAHMEWAVGTQKPRCLLDPTPYLFGR